MPKVQQFFYTRVEMAYSPNRRSGYQMVYRPPTLDEDAVSKIENRVQCFHQTERDTVRRQYFWIDDGTCVLTHTEALLEVNREIVDRLGRRGVFIVHGLIFSGTEFLELTGGNPFAIFNSFPFVADAEEMIRQIQAADTSSCIQVNVKARAPEVEWPELETEKLKEMVFAAEEMTKSGYSIMLVGSDAEIESTLQLALNFADGQAARHCTFDTHVDRCTVRAGEYWAVGASRRQGDGAYILIDAGEPRVISDLPQLRNGISGLYRLWLAEAARSQPSSYIAKWTSAAKQLAAAVEGHELIGEDSQVPTVVVERFVALFMESVLERLRSRLVEKASPELANALCEFLADTREPSELLLMTSRVWPDDRVWMSWIMEWFVARKPSISRKDQGHLIQKAKGEGMWTLVHWIACVGKVGSVVEREQALQEMDDASYQQCLQFMFKPVAPADYVHPSHLDALLSDPRLHDREVCTDRKFVDVVKKVLEFEEASRLDSFVERIHFLAKRRVREIARLLGDVEGKSGFEKAVMECLEEDSGSWWKRLLAAKVKHT